MSDRPADADDVVRRLIEWCSIPSISADPTHQRAVVDSAEWAAAACRDAGFDLVEILPTPGHPAVYAEWSRAGRDAPTLLVYGHHDVQPVDPLDAWAHPPFEPVIVGDELLARGAIDDKGQMAYQIEAARHRLGATGALPVNLKLLIEGEEEVGSPHFEDLLLRHRDRFACDAIVVSDTGMIAPDVPSTDVAMRGLVACTLSITTAATDLHSGTFGGAVPNPLHHLARLLADLHDADGRVALAHFYDAVRPLTDAEAASLSAQPFDEDEFRDLAGVAVLEGEAGRSTLERIGARPTAEVVGVSGGFSGDGIKTIVPAAAEAKLTFRLVPDQDPQAMMALVEAWLRDRIPAGVTHSLTWHGGVAPARTPVDHWAFAALCAAIRSVWGRPPLLTRVGGSGPEEILGRVLEAPVLFLGVGLPGDRIHAPNERMVMGQFWKGLRAAADLFDQLAAAYRGVPAK